MIEESFQKEFQNPGKDYRGTPFWAWNTKLDADILEKQIEQFREMGMGGFYIHTRVGLDTEYLGTEYMKCVKKSVEIAKQKGLFSCLYDEDRWPSGYAGGKVTLHMEFRGRNLLITPYRQGTKSYQERSSDSMASPSPQGNGKFLAAYHVALTDDGLLKHYERCEENAEERRGDRIWYVYLEIAHDSPWFNNQSYTDTLNPKAIQCFLEETHEKYKKVVGEEFGKTVQAIFTDEPQFGRKRGLGKANSKEEVMLPFTDDFEESYRKKYGQEFLDHVPELLWELPNGKYSEHRYYYHDHVTERFAEAYSDQVGAWCEKNNLLLAGHMMEEPTLQSQTQALGEVMRSLRGFTLPGIDMLCDQREYTTVKQAQSICHQYARKGVMSELYGVTNWDFDFRRHKLQGDWQAALGVTHRVHHLNWMSMEGEAKRDYPAAVGFQSPWYKEYGIIETHFARVNTVMLRGKPSVKIGVIHPVESMWLLFGPNEQTGMARQELENCFQNVTEWLLFQMLDFDYISESLLPAQWNAPRIGAMEYDVIVVPGCLTLRSTTVEILQELRGLGKEIVFFGKPAMYVDAKTDKKAEELAEQCTQIDRTKAELVSALEKYRLIDIRFHGEKHLKKPRHKKNWNGERTEKYLYQMREDGDAAWVFIANGRAVENMDLVLPDDVEIKIKGMWKISVWDTDNGTKKQITAQYENGCTVFYHRFYEEDSLLLRLEPLEEDECDKNALQEEIENAQVWESVSLYQSPVELVREEPNVLVLDQPEYSFGGTEFYGSEEILRIDNILRTRLKLPLRQAALAQPWTQINSETAEKICLRYRVKCEDRLKNVKFAMECMEATEILLDGKSVGVLETEHTVKEECYFVDPCMKCIALPELEKGEHTIELHIRFSSKVNLEACYLLGDFMVEVHGMRAALHAIPGMEERGIQEGAAWESLTEQGMPFYGGNVIYRTSAALGKGIYQLEVSKFRAPLLDVYVDGKRVGQIYRSPYKAEFQIENDGVHLIEIKSYGNRVNTFGAIHNSDEQEIYFDPNAWRTTEESWAYEYQLKKTGILKAPVLKKKVENQVC